MCGAQAVAEEGEPNHEGHQGVHSNGRVHGAGDVFLLVALLQSLEAPLQGSAAGGDSNGQESYEATSCQD